eukprot:6102792-Alexandrium_andersonii.AAC.1
MHPGHLKGKGSTPGCTPPCSATTLLPTRQTGATRSLMATNGSATAPSSKAIGPPFPSLRSLMGSPETLNALSLPQRGLTPTHATGVQMP